MLGPRAAAPKRQPRCRCSPPTAALSRELAQLDLDGITPLQAITKLYELAERARKELE